MCFFFFGFYEFKFESFKQKMKTYILYVCRLWGTNGSLHGHKLNVTDEIPSCRLKKHVGVLGSALRFNEQ